MRWGIRHQVLLLALVPTITISILLGAYFTSTQLHELEQSFKNRAKAIALKLATGAEYGIFSRNKSLLQNLAIAALNEQNLQSVVFFSDKGEELAKAGLPEFTFNPPLDKDIKHPKLQTLEHENSSAFIVPINTFKEIDDVNSEQYQVETLMGWLKIELETKSIHIRAYHILARTGLIFLLGLSMSALYAFQMSRNVTSPILELADAVNRIKKGEFNTRVRTSNYRELQILESGINTMAEVLENSRIELQNKVEQATLNLRRTLETIEVQNIELEIARRIAENANKIKSEFLADMSHEIRTPLNGLIGFANLLQKTELTQKQKDHLRIIQKSAHNLLAILNDILDFSKIEAGKLRIEHARMDIRECIDETLTLLAPYAHEKNLALTPKINTDIPKEIFSDPLRIKQIITNLVGNAIKFTEQGSVLVQVLLERETHTHLIIRVRVTDTGIGLSPEEQNTLFQAFNQTKSGTSYSGGFGLGLVICKKLVEQMGGTIGVESESKKGSTFWFTFLAEKQGSHSAFSTGIPAPILSAPFKKTLNILAVDDNPENLKLIKVLLEDYGVKVKAVENGSLAIEAFKTEKFDLIFMDIRMPKMNGVEAAKVIRDLEKSKNQKPTPIIALTAHALLDEKKAFLEVGIDDYLSKPVGEEDLKAVIHKWTEEREPMDASKTIDWELALKLAGGRNELAKELFTKLLQSLPESQANINEAYLNKDFEALRNHVHHLHGACCYCGVPELKQCAKALENAVAINTIHTLPSLLQALTRAIDAVLSSAKSFSETESAL